MGLVPAINEPAVGSARTVAPLVANDTALRTGVNNIEAANIVDGTITAAELATASVTAIKLADVAKLGLDDGTNVRRGALATATEESTTSTSYTTLTTPDQVANIVLPTNGIIHVSFKALWRGTHATGATTFGYAALFLGSDQLKANASIAAPAVTQVSLLSSSSGDAPASTTSTGDGGISGLSGTSYGSTTASTDASFVTTGTTMTEHLIEAAAGTYTISVKVKAATGCTVYLKERLLRVWITGF